MVGDQWLGRRWVGTWRLVILSEAKDLIGQAKDLMDAATGCCGSSTGIGTAPKTDGVADAAASG